MNPHEKPITSCWRGGVLAGPGMTSLCRVRSRTWKWDADRNSFDPGGWKALPLSPRMVAFGQPRGVPMAFAAVGSPPSIPDVGPSAGRNHPGSCAVSAGSP